MVCFAYVVGDSDSEKDKGLFVPPEVCENGKSAKDGNVIYVVQIEWYIFVWQLQQICDLFVELQTWFILARVRKKTFFPVSLYVRYILIFKNSPLLSLIFFSCVISNKECL